MLSDITQLKTEICRCYTDFNNSKRYGCLNEANTIGNTKSHKVIMDNRNVKLHDITDVQKISHSSVYTIFYKNMEMNKRFF